MPLVPAAPAPLPKWANVLLRALPFAWAVAESLVDSTHDASSVEDVEWRKVVLRWSRVTPSATTEDYAQIGFHVVNVTGGDVDTSWTTGDYTTCEGHLDEWWGRTQSLQASSHTLVDYRWYPMRFATVMSPDHRFDFSGPPVRVTPKNQPGTNINASLPYQVACSVTFDTGVPKHWGRVYIPGITEHMLSAPSRWETVQAKAVADSMAEFFDDLYGSEFQPVVPVTQVNKVLQPALLTVKQVRVDDIPDVIRRRRPRTPASRSIGVPTP